MAAKKRPEQRSTAAERHPGQPAAQPTGDEVYSQPSSKPRPEPQITADDQAEMEEFERAAAEAYEQLGRAAERLSGRAADAYRSGQTFVKENPGSTLVTSFVIGVVLGALFSRH